MRNHGVPLGVRTAVPTSGDMSVSAVYLETSMGTRTVPVPSVCFITSGPHTWNHVPAIFPSMTRSSKMSELWKDWDSTHHYPCFTDVRNVKGP